MNLNKKEVNRGKWTDEDYLYLIDGIFKEKEHKEMARDLNRTVRAIDNRVSYIKRHIAKDPSKKRWESFEEAYLKDNYKKMSAQAIAEYLNRGVGSVIQKFKALNYKSIGDLKDIVSCIDKYYNQECFRMELKEGQVYKIKRLNKRKKVQYEIEGEATCLGNYHSHILFKCNKTGIKECILKADLFNEIEVKIAG